MSESISPPSEGIEQKTVKILYKNREPELLDFTLSGGGSLELADFQKAAQELGVNYVEIKIEATK